MNEAVKKKRGRPYGSKSNDPADAFLPMVRVKSSQLEAYKEAAQTSEKTFSAWVRGVLDKAARRTNK